MDNDVKLNFNQLKKAIRYIKDDIDEIKKTDGYSSTGNNTGTITLSGTKKFETIKIYEDTIVCPPENVTLNRFYVYFTTFASVTVTVLGEQFITSPKKTYRLEMEYVSPFMGWNVSVTERDYTGDIDVDNLILWYNASDISYYKYDTTPVFLDRMCLNNYDGTKSNYYYGTKSETYYVINPTVEHTIWGGRILYCNAYLDSGETLIDRFGIDLSGFNGEEMTIELYTVVQNNNNTSILSLGDKNTTCTNCISMKNGSSGYIKIYDETGSDRGGKSGFYSMGLVLYSVTVSKTEGKAKIYENGELVADISVGNNITIGNRLLLGSTFDNTTTTKSAGILRLKDLRIYNKVLTPDQISKHYNVIKLCEGDLE